MTESPRKPIPRAKLYETVVVARSRPSRNPEAMVAAMREMQLGGAGQKTPKSDPELLSPPLPAPDTTSPSSLSPNLRSRGASFSSQGSNDTVSPSPRGSLSPTPNP